MAIQPGVDTWRMLPNGDAASPNAPSSDGSAIDSDSFVRALSQAGGAVTGSGRDVRQQVREAATQFVASAFIMPVLQSLHESPFAQEPFAPNEAQRRFAPMLDQQIADRVVGAANFSLVDTIVDRVMQHLQPAGAAGPADDEKGAVDVRA